MQSVDLKKQISILSFGVLLSFLAFSQQTRFSVTTDLGLQHSFKKEQRFTVIGNNTQAQFHFTPTDGLYVSFAYYSNGKFKNDITATAKSLSTTPQQVNYVNRANMRLKQFSVGWKKYLKGSSVSENGWNLYACAGFGLLLGRVENVHSVSIDTAVYNVPVSRGRANFKRLTFDAGAGFEVPLGGDIYLFTEGRVWIPTDGYPSRYIFVNDRAPWTGMLGVGLRILF